MLPAATVTLAGTVATDEFALARAIVVPPAGADLEIVIVAVEEAPPITDVGANVSPETVMGLTVNDADDVLPPALAERLTIVLTVT